MTYRCATLIILQIMIEFKAFEEEEQGRASTSIVIVQYVLLKIALQSSFGGIKSTSSPRHRGKKFCRFLFSILLSSCVLNGATTGPTTHPHFSLHSSFSGTKRNSARTMTWGIKSSVTNSLLLLAVSAVCLPPTGHAFSALSHFHGSTVTERQSSMSATLLTMRKQKASDRRTRRMQRGEDAVIEPPTLTSSPMALASWQHKALTKNTATAPPTGGRGRSRNRSNLYTTLSSYHGNFLSLLTAEYRAEVRFVIGRKKISIWRFGPNLAQIFVRSTWISRVVNCAPIYFSRINLH
jgi:hypothetical protein